MIEFEGRPVRIVKRTWKTALKNAGVRHVRFHDLRHTFNTRLMEAGVLQEIRMALMGHSTGSKSPRDLHPHRAPGEARSHPEARSMGNDSNSKQTKEKERCRYRKQTDPKAQIPLTKPERKPWKKKTPVEVVLEQADKLKAEIAEMEEELKAKRRAAPEVRRGTQAVRVRVSERRETDEAPDRRTARPLPALYSQEAEAEPIVYAKFFLPGTGWTWYVTEGSQQEDDFLFFGFVVGLESEFGYFLLSELESVRTPLGLAVERDLAFREGRLTDVVPAPDL